MLLPWLKNYNLLIFDEIDSTNSEAIRLIKSDIKGDFIIWAKSQTAGRGQKGRVWESEVGNLFASLVLDRSISITLQPQLSFLTAIALHDTILTLAKKAQINLKLGLKWPNDILINKSKVAGILLESIQVNRISYLIIGIGVNIDNSPSFASYPTTNLVKEGIKIEDASYLLDTFMSFFDKYYTQWITYGFLNIRRLWLSKAYNLNQTVTVDNGVDRISGTFKDIDLNGNMRVRLASGQICTFGAGDVMLEKSES